MIFEKEKKSEFIDKVINTIGPKAQKELNKICIEIFRSTTLQEREAVSKIDILLSINDAKYRLDGLLRLKKGVTP